MKFFTFLIFVFSLLAIVAMADDARGWALGFSGSGMLCAITSATQREDLP